MKKWVVLPLALLMASCSLFGKKPVKKKEDDTPKLVGRVASLPVGGGYALVETYGRWQVPTGGLLTSAGENRAATLVASGEKVERFAAADIKSGTLEPGDAVFYRPIKDSDDEDATSKDGSKSKEPEGTENSKKEPSEPSKP
jgi:hypothetical protein